MASLEYGFTFYKAFLLFFAAGLCEAFLIKLF
jgi:hypothetical protein